MYTYLLNTIHSLNKYFKNKYTLLFLILRFKLQNNIYRKRHRFVTVSISN